MEIKTIIENYQMQAVGGLAAAWQLWERTLIPSLLSGLALVWFGLVVYACPLRMFACGAHYDNSFEWIDTRNICHKHQHIHSIP